MAEQIDVGMKCIKYMIFVANFMFVTIGILLILIGTTVKAMHEDFEDFMAAHYFSPATLAIAIGVIIFFIAIFGCVGAIKESTCLINLFGFFLVLVMILEIGAVIAAFAMSGQIESTIREKMESSINDYYHDDDDRKIWDFTQERLFCCGVDGAADWSKFESVPSVNLSMPSFSVVKANSPDSTETTASASDGDGTVSAESTVAVATSTSSGNELWKGPSSCCRQSRHSDNVQCLRYDVYRDGCLDVLSYMVSESALLLGCAGLSVAFIQALGIIFAFMLAKAIRRLKTQDLVEREQNRQRIYEQLARGKDENPTPVLYTPTYSEA